MSLKKISLKYDFTIKNDVQKQFMMVDEYDTMPIFSKFREN